MAVGPHRCSQNWGSKQALKLWDGRVLCAWDSGWTQHLSQSLSNLQPVRPLRKEPLAPSLWAALVSRPLLALESFRW